jgi:MoxR-like ATPase
VNSPAGSARNAKDIEALKARVEQVIRGKSQVVELALVAVIAGGHILLEDVPGVGKTTLAHSLARALGGSFSRIQFTSDLLPADVLGTLILEPGAGSLVFRPGPVFANVVLADEVNRCTPKTQSALLEAMAERRVSVDGTSHALPAPFLVVATQNPHDHGGTFPLPDSQLDRFLLRLSMGYPDREAERAVLRNGGFRKADLQAALAPERIAELLIAAEEITMHEQLEDYLLELVSRTRSDPRFVRGVSPRGAEALYRAAKSLALVRGRAFVIPEDLRTLVLPVLAHRVIPRGEGMVAAERAFNQLLAELPPPA